jgi:hypothetical protein
MLSLNQPITLDIATWTVLNLIDNSDVSSTENGIRAAMTDRELCGDLVLDNRAPGRQLDKLEELGLIAWVGERVSSTPAARNARSIKIKS